ncbi:MAG: RDD family protein, partial [Bacteroidota bacterium]
LIYFIFYLRRNHFTQDAMKDENILDDNLYQSDYEANLVLANRWKRFANYIVDYIAVVLLMIVVFLFLDAMEFYVEEEGVFPNLIFIMCYIGYYTVLEKGLNGKTLGKFLTGTRAIHETGEPLSLKDAAIRSISRIVPFESFSMFSESLRSWHDKWADTVVIDEKQSDW